MEISKINPVNLLNIEAAQYVPIKVNTICPALILAASRNERVKGRTEMLMVSIKTKKGLSQ